MNIKGLPPQLRECLLAANIQDHDIQSIQTKLDERTSSQVISYMQLVSMKLRHVKTMSSEFMKHVQAHQERVSFTDFLQHRTAAIHGGNC